MLFSLISVVSDSFLNIAAFTRRSRVVYSSKKSISYNGLPYFKDYHYIGIVVCIKLTHINHNFLNFLGFKAVVISICAF